jgi:hypothetical protein
LLTDLIKRCWDANPKQRPTANELHINLDEWGNDVYAEIDTKFFLQYKKIGGLNQTSLPDSKSLKTNSRAIYTSRLLDFKNLPEPQNSQEINDRFYDLYTSQYEFSLEEEIEDWVTIHNDFDNEDIRGLWSKRLMQKEIKEWFEAIPSLNPAQDYEFVFWLGDAKQLTPNNPLSNDNLEQLRKEYQQTQLTAQVQISPKNK